MVVLESMSAPLLGAAHHLTRGNSLFVSGQGSVAHGKIPYWDHANSIFKIEHGWLAESYYPPPTRMMLLAILLVTTSASCSPGFYCPPGTTTPIICPAGSYCIENSIEPHACGAGMRTLYVGATDANACYVMISASTPSLRGSNSTSIDCSIKIAGWCNFSEAQKGGIIFGFVAVWVFMACLCAVFGPRNE